MNITSKDKENFFNKVKKTSNCWYWTGGLRRGYGRFRIKSSLFDTHRISFTIHNGKIPKGLCVLHKCDVRNCVNPKHLWLGTIADNNKDRAIKGRSADSHGENHSHSKLKNKDIKKIRTMYNGGLFTQKKLGRFFGVTHVTINSIVNNKAWTHI